jgi:hypothetical protein
MKHSSILTVHIEIICAQPSSHKCKCELDICTPPASYCLLQGNGGFMEDQLSSKSNKADMQSEEDKTTKCTLQ